MSGGCLTDYSYDDKNLAHALFGWNISVVYGFGPDKFYREEQGENGYEHYSHNLNREDYLSSVKEVRKENPFDDIMISELVYDVLCLIHSKDYAVSGDTMNDQYEDDVKAFKDKWFKGRFKKEYIKELVDEQLETKRKELYKALGVEDEDT